MLDVYIKVDSVRPRGRPRRSCRLAGAGVDANDLGDLRPALPGRDPHLERVARVDGSRAHSSEHGGVEEGVARTVGQLDEAEALFRFEPFDGRLDRRAGWF